MSDLAAALQIAIRVHANQRDRQGEPYLLHVLRVVEAVEGERAKVLAALHDVLEDGPPDLDLARAAVKRQLRDGSMSLEDALGHPAVQTMTLGFLLQAQSGWGYARVRRTLRRMRFFIPPVVVSELRCVGELTERERAAIVQACKETGR